MRLDSEDKPHGSIPVTSGKAAKVSTAVNCTTAVEAMAVRYALLFFFLLFSSVKCLIW